MEPGGGLAQVSQTGLVASPAGAKVVVQLHDPARLRRTVGIEQAARALVELPGGFVRFAGNAAGREQIGRAHRLNSSHVKISYAVFCLKKKKKKKIQKKHHKEEQVNILTSTAKCHLQQRI